MAQSKIKDRDNRTRNWTIVGYPGESLPENYRHILGDQLHLCYAESPVHDQDLNGDETEKKKHIHFVIAFDGPKSYDQVKEISDAIGAAPPKAVCNMRGMIRYLVHLDNPEKHQYPIEEIYTHALDIEDYFRLSGASQRRLLKQIQRFIRDSDIHYFSDLADEVEVMGDDEWYDIISMKNTLFLSAYIKSRRQKREDDLLSERRGY